MDKQIINDQVKPTVFDQLMEPVKPFVDEQSQKLTPHHNEKFSFKNFFRLLFFYFVTDYKSLNLNRHVKKRCDFTCAKYR